MVVREGYEQLRKELRQRARGIGLTEKQIALDEPFWFLKRVDSADGDLGRGVGSTGQTSDSVQKDQAAVQDSKAEPVAQGKSRCHRQRGKKKAKKGHH